MSDVVTGGVDLLSKSRGIFLGAAIGDALGWPQEQRSGIVGGLRQRDVEPLPRFRSWTRNAGTQYQRYADEVAAGEYSDDTQLILAVARSVSSTNWFDALSRAELPAWLLYQRGGGGATLRACRSWAGGAPPWIGKGSKASDNASAYFEAGGNGVAMRIAPHVVVASKQSVKDLVARVVLDGSTTHGHARALVGAAVYAVALRVMLAQSGTLGYGELIDAVLHEPSWQDHEVALRDLSSDWFESFRRIKRPRDHRVEWQETVGEMVELLGIARRSLDQGSLANDTEALDRLGTFNKRMNGAGTVTTAGAIYLSARTATRPMSGMLRAAFLQSADTDTLGSMTAALLGGLHGHDWLGELRNQVQDCLYIRDLADRCSQVPLGTPVDLLDAPGGRVTESMLRSYRDALGNSDAQVGRFVDGRPCRVLDVRRLKAKGNTLVKRYLLDVDSQTIRVDDVRKGDRALASPRRTKSRPGVHQVTAVVPELDRLERFYRATLKLPVRGTRDGDIVVCDLIRFRSDRRLPVSEDSFRGLLLTFDVPDLETIEAQLHREGIRVRIVDNGESRIVHLADPAGNELELREGS